MGNLQNNSDIFKLYKLYFSFNEDEIKWLLTLYHPSEI